MQSCMVALHSNIASVPGLLLTVYVGTEARIYMLYGEGQGNVWYV